MKKIDWVRKLTSRKLWTAQGRGLAITFFKNKFPTR